MPLDMYRLPAEIPSDIDFGPGCSNYSEMSGVSGYFVEHCTEIVNSLKLEDINNFKNTYDDQSRIKYLYKFATNVPLNPCETGKSFDKAQSEKIRGNEKYAEKSHFAAISAYSAGMTRCPLDTAEGRILFAILVANRSAAYFSLKQFDRAMFDINYLLKVGYYPDYLLFKVWFRKAKCHDMVRGQEDDAIDAYKKTIDFIRIGKLSEAAFMEKVTEINLAIHHAYERKNVPNCPMLESAEVDPETDFEANEKYPAVSKSVNFVEEYRFGRFARAATDIEPGEIIAAEEAHCAVLTLEHCTTNCLNCTQSCATPIVCEYCSFVVYCGWECKEKAEIFHRWECAFLATLYKSKCSLNCLMALRMVTQKPVQFFLTKNFDDAYEITSKPKYEFDDYDTVFNLCRHENVRKHEEFLHFSFMAIFLLRLLKTTDYFEDDTYDEVLSEEEMLIGGLMLRHLQLLQFNAHEVAELKYFTAEGSASSVDPAANNFKTVTVGGGLYPTLALFNHACEPSVIRYNKGNKMIIRTIKPIREGEIIYENYGPLYTMQNSLDRQVQLSQRYWFTCFCLPCTEAWPLYARMDENMIRFPCKKCRQPHWIHKETETPLFECAYGDCKEMNNILPNLIGLSGLEPVCNSAENFYKRKLYEKAIVKYGDALKVYYKFLLPPFPDIVKIQQRLRNCMVHLGNRCDSNYN